MRKHVEKLLNHQRDILSPKEREEVESALQQLNAALLGRVDRALLQKEMDNLEQVASARIRTYPNAGWRENIEVLLVALAVAAGCAEGRDPVGEGALAIQGGTANGRDRAVILAVIGTEAIANGVPAFKPPESRNAATTRRGASCSRARSSRRRPCCCAMAA